MCHSASLSALNFKFAVNCEKKNASPGETLTIRLTMRHSTLLEKKAYAFTTLVQDSSHLSDSEYLAQLARVMPAEMLAPLLNQVAPALPPPPLPLLPTTPPTGRRAADDAGVDLAEAILLSQKLHPAVQPQQAPPPQSQPQRPPPQKQRLVLRHAESQASAQPPAPSPKIDPAREAQLRKAFDSIDANGNGTLSRAEVIRACRNDADVRVLLGLPARIAEGASRDAFERIFQQLDPDESRDIDFGEFCAFFVRHSPRDNRRSSRERAAPAAVAVAVAAPHAATPAPPRAAAPSRSVTWVADQSRGQQQQQDDDYDDEYDDDDGDDDVDAAAIAVSAMALGVPSASTLSPGASAAALAAAEAERGRRADLARVAARQWSGAITIQVHFRAWARRHRPTESRPALGRRLRTAEHALHRARLELEQTQQKADASRRLSVELLEERDKSRLAMAADPMMHSVALLVARRDAALLQAQLDEATQKLREAEARAERLEGDACASARQRDEAHEQLVAVQAERETLAGYSRQLQQQEEGLKYQEHRLLHERADEAEAKLAALTEEATLLRSRAAVADGLAIAVQGLQARLTHVEAEAARGHEAAVSAGEREGALRAAAAPERALLQAELRRTEEKLAEAERGGAAARDALEAERAARLDEGRRAGAWVDGALRERDEARAELARAQELWRQLMETLQHAQRRGELQMAVQQAWLKVGRANEEEVARLRHERYRAAEMRNGELMHNLANGNGGRLR